MSDWVEQVFLVDMWAYALMALLIGGSAFLQGVGGVGFTMFAAPVALIIFPDLVPGPLLTLGGMVTFLTAVRERPHIMWNATSLALGGRVAGAVIAVFILSQLSGNTLNLVFAGMILTAVLLSVSGIKIMATRANLSIAGLLSGVMGTLTSVGAPPLAIALQHNAPPNIRATIGSILAIGSMVSLVALVASGHYGMRELLLTGSLVPFMVVGFWLSNRVRHAVSSTALRRGLLLFCAASSISLIIKTLATG